MTITTKRGDKGRTLLYLGGTVPKDDLRIEGCGELDELCSFLGMASNLVDGESTRAIIRSIQRELFVICSEIATSVRHVGKLKKRIGGLNVRRLEDIIEGLEAKQPREERCFCIPGENLASASLDVARAVTRRAERRVVALNGRRMLKNPHIIVYLNRLSDILFLLARCQGARKPKI